MKDLKQLRRSVSIVIVVFGTVLLSYSATVTRQTSASREFLITKWTTEEGLPQNTVTSIVQTNDGYIWLGTFGGLARFDGVKFTVFDSTNAPGLTSNRLLALYEDRFKRLWIGAETGEVYILDRGKFTEFSSVPDFKRRTVWQFIEDDGGKLYIASDSGVERVEFGDDGSVIPDSIKLISRIRSFKLAKGPDNTIWTSSGSAYVVKDDQLVKAESLGLSLPVDILKIDFSSGGRMLVETISSLGWFDDGKFTEIRPQDERSALGYCTPAFKGDDLWCQQGHSLFEFKNGTAAVHDLENFVAAGSRVVFFDKEDNIWLATESDGLVRLTRRKIALAGDLTDLEIGGRFVVAEDSLGTVWLGGQDLLRVKDGLVDRIEIPKRGAGADIITALAFDANNVMWAGGTAGVYTLKDRILVPAFKIGADSIHSLFFDDQAALWIGSSAGLWRLKDEKFTHFTTDNGLASNSVHFIKQTKDGTMWIGTMGGLSRFKDGTFENLTSANGLSGNFVREIVEDDDGTLWIGTYGGGINRLRDGKIDVVTTANGLHDNFVSRILADGQGKFWILGNLGISGVSRDELKAVADRRRSTLISSVYGVADGMISGEASGGHQPAGVKTKDGRLWFPMIKDVVIIDPSKTVLTPPRVVIEGVSTRSEDGRPQQFTLAISESNSISIPTGQRDLEIQVTGLSFTKPEKIRFFYKLDGLDDDWTDAGTRRTAFYPYLPAGNYTFQVRAVNANGIMSENTAILTIDVAKYFWQTWWFNLAAAIFLVVVAVVLYRYKMLQIEAEQLREVEFSKQLLLAHELERSRIATELHDGLGQDLLIIKNWAQQGMESGSGPDEVQNRLKQISESAAEALEDTRTIVRNLSPQNLKRFGLTEAVRNLIDQTEMATGVAFEQKVDKIDGIFPEEAEISIYRIVQEGLSNIIKHSESPRGRIIVTRQERSLRMIIQDFGKGFSRKQQTDNSLTGFGLEGIAQRVRLLGGECTIESVVFEGTRIVIILRF